ncbi:MAG: flagellar biosynthesis protein FlhF [Bacteroidota bacterium]
MQVKKYLAPSLKEATQQMKKELGIDAIILGTRIIEGEKRRGMKNMYEITAGIDQAPTSKTAKENLPTSINSSKFQDELEKLSKRIYGRGEESSSLEEKGNGSERKSSSKEIEKAVDELANTLEDHEVNKNIIKDLTKHLWDSYNFLESSNLESYLISSMASLIPTTSFKVKKNKTTKIALVGPTGVGKTTCIAKLAVISKIIHKLKVGLISIDTYRLGAIDQLRIFSEVSDIEMEVAYEPEDMPKLIKKFKNKELIFIDTVGRSQKAKQNLESIKKYLDAAGVEETILVVNSTSSTRTLNDIAEKFKVLNYKSVIFSKVDEAVAFGNIMNLSTTHNVPVMFLTNGQTIPDDIVSVNPNYLANLIYTGKLFS